MKATHYHTAKPVSGICKQYAIWGREGSVSSPIVYLQRPKWIKSDAAWQKIVESVQLNLPRGFDVE